MTLKVSKRGKVPPFIVMDVLRAANNLQMQGGGVLHLELGQPAKGAPSGVVNFAKEMISNDPLGYTEAFGLISVRNRISEYYEINQGLKVDPEQIIITTGSSGGFVLAFTAAFDAGARVAIATPSYPGYRNILMSLNIEPVFIETGPETNFQLTTNLLNKISAPIDGLIIASPSNPTGTMLSEDALKTISDYCTLHNIRLISDEIYHGITYHSQAVTARKFNKDAIIINSFSKYFSMTGWRVGWMVAPSDLLRSIECLAQNLFISAPTLSQHAAAVAFNCINELDQNVAIYEQNRAVLLKGLPKIGLDQFASVDGAFYIYANVSHLTNDSEKFCRQMLKEIGVATTPGTDFDLERGRSYIRFSFSGPPKDIEEAVQRIKNWLPNRAKTQFF